MVGRKETTHLLIMFVKPAATYLATPGMRDVQNTQRLCMGFTAADTLMHFRRYANCLAYDTTLYLEPIR